MTSTISNKITPHLWFDTQAKEAAEFYTSVYADSRIKMSRVLENTPSGDAEMVALDLFNQEFTFISAGPYFKINPSISFFISCNTKEEVDSLWNNLAPEGMALMELGTYPFSERYGWIQDKFGVSWQLSFTSEPITQKITPSFLFVGANNGKAEEAINFYTSIFDDSKITFISRYGKDQLPDKEGNVNYASFQLSGQNFSAMDSALDHKFAFNEAVSLIVDCKTQEEIDYFWDKLSAVPEAEQCGWLKDKYGLSWQIVPTRMNEMLQDENKERIARVTEAFLKMKKFDLAELERVYNL